MAWSTGRCSFHCADVGPKMDAIRAIPNVAYQTHCQGRSAWQRAT
jgi:hypothetical protein